MALTEAEKEAKRLEKEAEKEAKKGIFEVEVNDPEVLKPVELPLVIKPADGAEWQNEAQAEYARYLNAYAYKNPKKFATKKVVLIARLKEIGADPSKLHVYKGTNEEESKLTFRNQLLDTK
jgi:hypothetical protein